MRIYLFFYVSTIVFTHLIRPWHRPKSKCININPWCKSTCGSSNCLMKSSIWPMQFFRKNITPSCMGDGKTLSENLIVLQGLWAGYTIMIIWRFYSISSVHYTAYNIFVKSYIHSILCNTQSFFFAPTTCVIHHVMMILHVFRKAVRGHSDLDPIIRLAVYLVSIWARKRDHAVWGLSHRISYCNIIPGGCSQLFINAQHIIHYMHRKCVLRFTKIVQCSNLVFVYELLKETVLHLMTHLFH